MTTGRIFLALVVYCTVGAGVYFVSLLSLQQGILLDIPWIVSAQKKLYRAGISGNNNSWLTIPGCIEQDPELIYTPATGTCHFENIEYRTTLNFTGKGRNTGSKPEGTGIAVIGDSHAMGWGVNDQETYAARLQELTGRPVYNLGVASYGTAREVIRLEKSGLLDKVDTVIIQYCNNDYNENTRFDTASREQLHEKVFGEARDAGQPRGSQAGYIARGYWLTLKAPFSSLADRLRRKNFRRHYEPFMAVIRRHHDALRGKRIIVFYSNPFGQKYRNYPAGRDAEFADVFFTDLGLARSDYYKLDSHLTPAGHRKVAERLFRYLSGSQQ